jgi:serine/threonine-protein kinase
VAHEVFTGRSPWGSDRDGSAKIMQAILTQEPPSARAYVPALQPAVDGVLARAMAKSPSARFPSMDDLVRAFDDAVR